MKKNILEKRFQLFSAFFLSLLTFSLAHSFAYAEGIDLSVTILGDTECVDGIDNDSDGYIDFPNDFGCSSYYDDDELSLFQCFDGIDNDSDGYIDFPDDTGCASLADDNEINESSGGSYNSVAPHLSETRVVFNGKGHALGKVFLLKDSKKVSEIDLKEDAFFNISISGISEGDYVFSLYGEDKDKRKSVLATFPLNIKAHITTQVSGIFLSPTADSSKRGVKKGDSVSFFGYGFPGSKIRAFMDGLSDSFMEFSVGQYGYYSYNIDSSNFDNGSHEIKFKSFFGNEESSFSKALNFEVGGVNIPIGDKCKRSDVNCDGRVDVVDFSIMAYWHGRASPPARVNMNSDNKIDIVDFSVLAYNWTG